MAVKMYINVIGAGLAGCEAAWQLASLGFNVKLYEMKPKKYSPAHKYSGFAELVCSNSLKASRLGSASGLLKTEMKLLGSLIIPCAEKSAVSAGGALAVNREIFSDMVTETIKSNSKIEIIYDEVTQINENEYTIIATGPLTSDSLSDEINRICGKQLSFYDAAAPIVKFESINMEKAFLASRYGKGEPDYINCPMNKEEYSIFHQELIHAESAKLEAFENLKVFEGCMPVEILAKRGEDSIRFGPLKPVGLTDPNTGKRPYACVQLRKENNEGTMYNLVGFQTNLKFHEQKRVFSLIPGLEEAEFVRYGVMHRNTFIDSPRLLNKFFNLRSNSKIYFAGQITGVEGYCESAMSGIIAGQSLGRKLLNKIEYDFPKTGMIYALTNYISDESVYSFQPMGANMGLLPALDMKIKDKQIKYEKISERAITDLKDYLNSVDV